MSPIGKRAKLSRNEAEIGAPGWFFDLEAANGGQKRLGRDRNTRPYFPYLTH